ncbi:Lrp/AsnC family transcriptional regulator [Phaeobacter inhibens]|uniref:Lrp/AsnC family transcriptional regulator n=1 Tax=Phaeobacter inhibens TaxID=221822 RepID=UPI00295EF05B|nr:Lrp/AsnC family transcriptional regulator [Phaeobacter inhibens]
MGKIPMDLLDFRILSALQQDGQISMARLSEKVGLSLSACHRRVKMMEANGMIEGYAARLDRKKVGLELQIFIEIKLVSQQRENIQAFEDAISHMPEVLECHLISGEFDYLMRVAARNTDAYEKLYRNRLSEIPSVAQMKTLLGVSTVKEFRGYHLE